MAGMRLLAFEYACAGGEGGGPFLDQGLLMLSHLLRHLSGLGLERITTMRSDSLGAVPLFADKIVTVKDGLLKTFAKELREHDAVWIIAPECGGRLLELTRMAESLGVAVVGSSSAAVEVCGDKLLTCKALEGVVPTPRTRPFNGVFDEFPCVVKPADGAGCSSTFYIEDEARAVRFEAPPGEFVVQPYVEGAPMSAAIVSNRDEAALLGVSRQLIKTGPLLEFLGVEGPVEYAHKDKLTLMMNIIRKIIPGLNGYWGVDFIDGPAGPVLMEINPRPTSSYPLYGDAVPFQLIFPNINASPTI
ncbi:MAG: ATP-grasp domain-containing protein [Nitrospinae bacterium]|nr:ATP-grasp domain-containing protein [Nitrospinota bacterium]